MALKSKVKSKSGIVMICVVGALAVVIGINVWIQGQIADVQKAIDNLRVKLNLHQGKIAYYINDSEPYGLSMGDWTAKWWQWVASTPEDENPAYSASSQGIYEQPNYPLYLLTGGYNTAVNRTVTIPADKAIMFPVFNTEYSSYEDRVASTRDELQLRAFAESETDKATYLGAELDGKPLQYYRIQSPLFVQFLPKENLFDVKPNENEINKFYTVADGYYVFLDPLPVGKHIIHLKGVAPDYKTEVTYDVNIVNAPSPKIDHYNAALDNIKKGIEMLRIVNDTDADYYFQTAQQELTMLPDDEENKYQSSNLTATQHVTHALNFLRGLNATLSAEHAQDAITSLTGRSVGNPMMNMSMSFNGGDLQES
jgi:hypothetical protein